MRKPTEHRALDGSVTWKVRYRSAGVETSRTFRRKPDALTFASLLGSGKAENVADALAWLAARERQEQVATFGEFFKDYTAQLTGVTPRTRADYEALHRRYLTNLDPLPLPLITRAHVATIVNVMEGSGLAPKTIKNTVHLLSSVLGLAVDERLIDRNPTRRVRLPKARLVEDDTRFLTAEEFVALVGATPEHYRPLVVFLVGSGLRWSEATALQARHVDLVHGTVRVQRAWKRIPGGWEIGPPKSAAGNRTVNPAVMALAAVAPLLRKPSDLVFLTPRGNVVRHSNFYNRIWVPACERAGLDPRPTPHDTRHTFASWLISEGVPLEAVQDQLGHEDIRTTRKIYAKLMPAVGVAAGKAASAALARALPNGMDFSVLAIEPGVAHQGTDAERVAANL